MERALWDWIVHPDESGVRRNTRQRPVMKLRPACEPMDGRQLLSTLAPASMAELSPSSPAAIANAAAILNLLAPRAFAQLERNLPRAQQHARVTPTQANQLAQDEATIIRGIESSGLIPSIVSEDVGQVQDLVALSVIEKADTSIDWLNQEEALDGCIGGTKVNPQLIHRTIEQMFAIANTAQVSSDQYVIMQGDLNALEKRAAADPTSTSATGRISTIPSKSITKARSVNSFTDPT